MKIWPWFKKKHPDDINKNVDHDQRKKSKAIKVPIIIGTGSILAGLAGALLGDPTFGAATAAVIGAILGMTGTAHSYIKEGRDDYKNDSNELIALELRGINQTLRAILFMAIFGGLVYVIRFFIEMLSKQFQIINDNPLSFIFIMLSLVFIYVTKISKG